mmetsp:Transcript_11551/g.15988  ORF Transcript_11551/g.15988 Transcript_11551/m.15988 type:complete len:84 (-) Transcript_11551:1052-1303(-)
MVDTSNVSKDLTIFHRSYTLLSLKKKTRIYLKDDTSGEDIERYPAARNRRAAELTGPPQLEPHIPQGPRNVSSFDQSSSSRPP